MNFKSAAVPYFYYIAGQTPIVPAAHLVEDRQPGHLPDTKPIGTGPYVVNPCAKANITYTANPHYWQPGEPHIAKVEYPAYTSNNTANDRAGQRPGAVGLAVHPGHQVLLHGQERRTSTTGSRRP